MFKPVDSRQSFPKMEEDVLRLWKERDVFRKSVEERPADKSYIFYEGPPTANNKPGVHHVLARVFKDLFPRYKTMRGYRVERKAGWDTHGLPVELEVERELGLGSKTEIEEFGIEEFNRRCRESVFRYVKDWESLTERIGFWADMEHAYVTCDNSYIESVWWIVKQLWDNDLLYLDYRSTPHCPRCGTSLSDAEVALGYQEDTEDPSVYVKFRVLDDAVAARHASQLHSDAPTYLLAWTTTPWTLPGNTALAVHPEAEYAVVEMDGERIVLAAALVSAVVGAVDAQHAAPPQVVVGNVKGSELVGLRYQPLYEPTTWGVQAMGFDAAQNGRLAPVEGVGSVKMAYTVIGGDFVSLDDGTGIVHVAPAFGGEDFDMGKQLGLLFLQPVDLRGRLPEGSPWAGQFVKDADGGIMDDLASRGLLLRRETIRHTYPFCWRCGTPLLYYAKPSWYARTTAVKTQLIAGNERIGWYPEHIKRGRFGDWLRNNVDWAVSRERYWGTPLPVWQCADCGERVCVGSRAEMRERALDAASVDALDDLHRPYIDRIELRCPSPEGCGGVMRRVPEVLDAWFDSGAMPYAQWGYPQQNEAEFGKSFPADFICEAVDQTRGWFYTLHAEAALLNSIEQVPEGISYRNVICLGHIQDDKGRKMSKSVGNVVDPISVLDEHGADALRWYLFTATRPGEPRRFSGQLVSESLRRFLLTFWNTYSFFVTYANLDDWRPTRGVGAQRDANASETPRPDEPAESATSTAEHQAAPLQNVASELDRWVLSELNALTLKVTEHLDEYDPTTSGRAIQDFVEDLSNWYVRRSRRRFWKGELDADKVAAYRTLYECLVTVTKLLAPFTPFVAEAMYQNLVCSVDKEAPESVHLASWPEADASLVDERLMEETQLVMRVVSLGRAARQKGGIKVRQPLASVKVKTRSDEEEESLKRLESQILDELNVKRLDIAFDLIDDDNAEILPDYPGAAAAADEAGYAVWFDEEITPELLGEGLARELVHRIQGLRKSAGFEISDRIVVHYTGLRDVFETHGDYVRAETLADELLEGSPTDGAHGEEQKIAGEMVTLAVRRV